MTVAGILSPCKTDAKNIPRTLSPEAQLSILTVGPSQALFTTFGHTAIRISDTRRGIDAIYNYGTFDRDTERFLLKFLKGTLRYHLSRQSFSQFKYIQQQRERRIRELVLDLSPSKIRDLLVELEEKSSSDFSYEYRFFSRNCVTLVRDLLERHDILRRSNLSASVDTTATYRELMNAYLPHKPWLSFGVNIILGKHIDRSLSPWNQINLPRFFHNGLVSYRTDRDQSLLANTQSIYTPPTSNGQSIPIRPVYVSGILAIMAIILTISDKLKSKGETVLHLLLFGLPGIIGLFLLGLHLWSNRPTLHYNIHILWMLPGLLMPLRALASSTWRDWKFSILTFILVGHLAAYIGGFFGIQKWPLAIIPIVLAQLTGTVSLWFENQTYDLNLR